MEQQRRCALHGPLMHGCARVHLCGGAPCVPHLIMVLLYMMTEWLDWMKPMPPMSAARLNTWSQPSTTCRR